MDRRIQVCLFMLLFFISGVMAQKVAAVLPEFSAVVDSGAAVREIASALQFTEGPVWIPSSNKGPGYLLFTDIPANRIYRWSPGAALSVWREPSGNANGLTLDLQGRLIACEHGNRRVSRTMEDGSVVALCTSYRGLMLNSPNDAAVAADGAVWFTDPPYGLEGREQLQPKCNVFRLGPAETEPAVVVDDFNRPNGIVFSPDQRILYIADSGSPHHVRAFRVEGARLYDGRIFAVISPGGPDGMRVDRSGRLYVTAGDGVQVFRPDGKLIGKILTPQMPTNCCFGGDEMKTLFITARPNVYMVQLKVAGCR